VPDSLDLFCKRCGNPHAPGRKFCSNCGSRLDSDTSPGSLGNPLRSTSGSASESPQHSTSSPSQRPTSDNPLRSTQAHSQSPTSDSPQRSTSANPQYSRPESPQRSTAGITRPTTPKSPQRSPAGTSQPSPSIAVTPQRSTAERIPTPSESDKRRDALPPSNAQAISPDPPSVLPPMLDRISFPGKLGRLITIGLFFVLTSAFAVYAIRSISVGDQVASVWWILATLAGCFLLGEKALVRVSKGGSV
jgi:hypothetical protein